jgi:hypothetical protein
MRICAVIVCHPDAIAARPERFSLTLFLSRERKANKNIITRSGATFNDRGVFSERWGTLHAQGFPPLAPPGQ